MSAKSLTDLGTGNTGSIILRSIPVASLPMLAQHSFPIALATRMGFPLRPQTISEKSASCFP
jgi:hypothetical protein